jgi:hypothetical protein
MNNFATQIKASLQGIDFSNAPPTAETIKKVEEALGCKLASQLKAYLTEFGYIGCGSVEMYGVNERQGLNSDMVKQTLHLNRQYPQTKGYIAIENQGEGDYIMCDSKNMIFDFIPEEGSAIKPLKLDLLNYILKRCKDK